MTNKRNGKACRKRKLSASEAPCIEKETAESRSLFMFRNSSISSVNVDRSSLLSDDLLRYVFQFFVSSGSVDVSTVQPILLTSKRFCEVVGGRYLWRMAKGCSELEDPESLPITGSLYLREPKLTPSVDDIEHSTREATCLAGFVHLNEVHQADPSCRVYEVKERSSGKFCFFLIHNDRYNKRTEVVKELFANHYLLGELFLRGKKESTSKYPFSALGGIHFLSIRNKPDYGLLQWYDKDEALFQDLDCYRALRSMEGNDRMIKQVKKFIGETGTALQHLLRLEKAVRSPKGYVNSGDRATLIDWIVEITEVFDLDDSALHRGVGFLDRVMVSRSTEVGKQ